jgi:hypothetical protein
MELFLTQGKLPHLGYMGGNSFTTPGNGNEILRLPNNRFYKSSLNIRSKLKITLSDGSLFTRQSQAKI